MGRTALVAIALLTVGCSELGTGIGEPVQAGIDSTDADVAEHFDALLRAVHAAPSSARMRGRLGMAYDVNGFRDGALETYRQAQALDPVEFRWPYYRALLLADDGDHEAALGLLDQALRIDSSYAPAWLWRGSWLLKAQRPPEAADAYRRAGELGAGPHAEFGRCQALMAQGRHAEAVRLLEPLAEALHHPYVHRTFGEALRAVGRLDEARAALARGREAQPLSWPDQRSEERNAHLRGHASYMLAKDLSAAGDPADALAILARLQRHHPEQDCAKDAGFFLACNLMNSRGIAEDRAGRPDDALATVRRGLDLNPDFAPFHLTVANLLRDRRELEAALGHVQRAIDLSPASGYSHEQHGRLLFGLHRYGDAQAAFEKALRLEPGKRTTLFYLGLAEAELGEHAAAAARFERVVAIEPAFALGHVFLARSLGEAGRLVAARQAQADAKATGADPRELRQNEVRLRELEAARESP